MSYSVVCESCERCRTTNPERLCDYCKTLPRTPADEEVIARLKRRGVVTADPTDLECCGLARDNDGFCAHRPWHPIYIGPVPQTTEDKT